MGKSEEEKTDNDYKDGAVTKNALQVITIIGEKKDMIIFLQQAKQPSMNICFLSWRRLRWIKILKVYFLL